MTAVKNIIMSLNIDKLDIILNYISEIPFKKVYYLIVKLN